MDKDKIINDLRMEKSSLKALIDANPDLLLWIDDDGTILECKPGEPHEQYGPKEDLIGKKIFDLATGDEVEKFRNAFEDVKKTGEMAICEYSMFLKGQENFFEARIIPYIPFDVKQYIVISRNITAKKSEQRIRQKFTDLLSNIIEFLPDATFVLDTERRVIAWNRAIEQMTGVKKQDIIGKGNYEYAIPFYGKRRPILIDLLFEENEEIEKLYDFVKKTGDTYYVEVYVPGVYSGKGGYLWASASKFFDEEGNIAGAIESIRDITEIKKMEKALLEEKERLASLLDSVPLGLMLVEKDGTFSYLNREFIRMFGYTPEEIPNGREWFQKAFPDKEERKKVIKIWKEDVENLKPNEKIIQNLKVTDKKGNERDIQFHTTILPTGEALTACEDITEQKILEKRLMHAQKMEAIGVLAGGIAHDFNNLLMAIQGNVSLMLLKLDSTHPFYKRLTTIEELIKNGAFLIKQLLEFSRGAQREIRPINIKETLKKTVEMFGRMKKEITMHFNYTGDPEIIEADENQIELMLMNLFINAWQAMTGHGDIFVDAEGVFLDKKFADNFLVPQGRYIKISVRDTGIGMDEKTLQRIFEPFFTTKEMGKGTGLGLTTVYGIVKSYNGIIDVQSELGKGSTFTIYLPVSQKPSEVGIIMPRTKKEMHRTVLLVDDEKVILEVGKELLEALGYKVLTAENGFEAVKIYREKQNEIDLIILDMVMPKKDGEETFEELKAINKDVKVLIATGYSMDGSVERIMKKGCNGFLQKPFNLNELSTKIKEILGE